MNERSLLTDSQESAATTALVFDEVFSAFKVNLGVKTRNTLINYMNFVA